MTSSLRILTTATIDSTPSVLLVSSSGDNILINCGEGCQRAFLEVPGLRVRSIRRICVTGLSFPSIGGLPGMILTASDVAESAMSEQAKHYASNSGTSPAPNTPVLGTDNKKKRKGKASPNSNVDNETQPKEQGLALYGPQGLQSFLHSLRHFMRRDRFPLKVHEGVYRESLQNNSYPLANNSKKKRKKNSGKDTTNANSSAYLVQTLPFQSNEGQPICSFIVRTPPILGQFLPQEAAKLQIPKGPLYGKLKNGSSVTFTTPDGHEQTVHSHQVVTKGSPGVAVIVVYCPSLSVLEQLSNSSEINQFANPEHDEKRQELDVIVHMAPKNIVETQEYQLWTQKFEGVDHIWLDTYESILGRSHELRGPSPFHGAALDGYMRSRLYPKLYPSPADSTHTQTVKSETLGTCFIVGTQSVAYALIPRARKGVGLPENFVLTDMVKERQAVDQELEQSGALEVAKTAIGSVNIETKGADEAEIVFTGTGSALPSKHRNVTGIFVKMHEGKALLLDCGEGTVGQLLRGKTDCDASLLLKSIRAVWISHPHTDHHVGIIRLLAERSKVPGCEPLMLLAPPNLFQFLSEYEEVNNSFRGSYEAINCYQAMPGQYRLSKEIQSKLQSCLGISSIKSVPVSHCRHAFGLVLDCDAFGRLVYSGDCRPSQRLAQEGTGADILIHEATFEDGMEEDAVLKKHSTIGEALSIGHKMKAKAVILTHFSQRYPRIAPSGTAQTCGFPIVFAFDYMRVTKNLMDIASNMTAALRLIYPDEEETKITTDGQAAQILSVPGAFADASLMGHT